MGALHSMYYAKVWWGGNTAMHIMQYKKYKMQHKFKKSQKNNTKTKMHKSGGEKTQPCIFCNTRSFCPAFKPQLIVCIRCFNIDWDLYNNKYDFLGSVGSVVIYFNTCVRYIVNCYVFFLVKRKSLKEFEFQLCSCVW